MLQDVELEDGSVAPIVGPAAKFSRTPTSVRTSAAQLGADNTEILASLGYSLEDIETFERQQVI